MSLHPNYLHKHTGTKSLLVHVGRHPANIWSHSVALFPVSGYNLTILH